jgi:hypothetical protein
MSDSQSEVGSETAIQVFTTLSNPTKVDTSSLETNGAPARSFPVMPPVEEIAYDDEDADDNHSESSQSTANRDRPMSPSSTSESENEKVEENPASSKTLFGLFGSPAPAPETKTVDKWDTMSTISSKKLLPAPQNVSDMEILEKQSVLLDLQRLKMQGVQLTKEWSINDRLEDMVFECRTHTLHMEEMSNVNMMKDGLRIACTGLEMLNKRIGFLDLDGWSTEACKDLDRHDANLCKIYRKYWKRSHSSSPELDIATAMLASMGMYHFKQTMNNKMKKSFGGASKVNKKIKPIPVQNDSDDDEEAPP